MYGNQEIHLHFSIGLMMHQGLLLLLAMLAIKAIETGIILYIGDKKNICFEKKVPLSRTRQHFKLVERFSEIIMKNFRWRNARCHQVVPGDSSQCILPSCAPLCDEDCVFLDCHDGHCQWNDIPCTDTDHGSQTLRPLCKQEQTVCTYLP